MQNQDIRLLLRLGGSSIPFGLLYIAGLGALVPLVSGQTTNATCNYNATTSWLFNTHEESPCLVWSKLQSLCIPQSSYVNVPPLSDPSYGYANPGEGASDCQCNVISYALMAGCTWCQLGNVSTWPSEDDYKKTCEHYTDTGLSFNQSVVAIPAYAWKPWNGSRWSPDQAISAAPSYVSSQPSGTTTLSRSFPPITTTITPNLTPNLNPPSSSSGTSPSDPSSSSNPDGDPVGDASSKMSPIHWGPIVGGIAGGIFLLVIIFLIWRNRTRSKRKRHQNLVIRYAPPKTPGTPGLTAKSRSQSFLNFLGGGSLGRDSATPSEKEREREGNRITRLMRDPRSFNSPRPAPKPGDGGVAGGGSKLRYTTTQERLKAQAEAQARSGTGNNSDDSISVRSTMSFQEVLNNSPHLMASNVPPSNGQNGYFPPHYGPGPPGGVGGGTGTGLMVNESWSGGNVGEDDPLELPGEEENLRDTWIMDKAPPLSTDFSQPRPFSASDIQTLPSLYEPHVGAPRFTAEPGSYEPVPSPQSAQTAQTGQVGQSVIVGSPSSPDSRYTVPEGRRSVGDRLRSVMGREGRGGRDVEEVPPVPRVTGGQGQGRRLL